MPVYVATVYFASATALAVDGDAAIRRTIYRAHANTPAQFEAQVRDAFGQSRDVDMLVEFGPIGEPWSHQR